MIYYSRPELDQMFSDVSIADFENRELLGGTDETGLVTFFADEEGLPIDLEVSKAWRESIPPAELGNAILQARELSLMLRSILTYTLEDRGLLQRTHNAVGADSPVDTGPLEAASSESFESRIETVLDVLRSKDDYLEAVADAANEGFRYIDQAGFIRLSATAGRPTSLEFDLVLLQFATPSMLANAVREALDAVASSHVRAQEKVSTRFPLVHEFMDRKRMLPRT